MGRVMHGAALAVLTAVVALAAMAATAQAAGFRSAPCEDVAGIAHERLSCGYLDVAESPAGEGGRTLSLAVAVLAASDQQNKKPDPIIFLHGGPGGEIVRHTLAFASHPMGRTRDIITFDQRAAGVSLPVDCTGTSREFFTLLAADLPADVSVEQQARIEMECREEMLEAGADLDGYGTRETVGDMEDLREALGIETWNLFGVSYGTTVAIDYVGQHPDRVRAVVLDSVYPPGRPGGDVITRNYARSLDELFDACRVDKACRAAFPGLQVSYLSALMSLDREPLVLPVRGIDYLPRGEFVLNGQDLALIVHQMMYQRPLITLVPKTIDLVADRRGDALEGLASTLAVIADQIDLTARLNVECRERFSLEGRELTDMTARERFLRDRLVFFDSEEQVCGEWAPHFSAPETAEPISSDVPALLYSGQFDPITPPHYTSDTLGWFANGQYVHVPEIGHGADRTLGCVREITAGFFDNPDEIVADACIGRVAPVAFVTDVALTRGAMPFAREMLQEMRLSHVIPLGLALAAMISGLIWTGIAQLRTDRHGTNAAAVMASISLGLCAVMLLGFLVGVAWIIAGAATGPTPAILAFGLPANAAPILWLPWATLGLFAAGMTTLVVAMTDMGTRHRIYPLLLLTAGAALALWQITDFGFYLPV